MQLRLLLCFREPPKRGFGSCLLTQDELNGFLYVHSFQRIADLRLRVPVAAEAHRLDERCEARFRSTLGGSEFPLLGRQRFVRY